MSVVVVCLCKEGCVVISNPACGEKQIIFILTADDRDGASNVSQGVFAEFANQASHERGLAHALRSDDGDNDRRCFFLVSSVDERNMESLLVSLCISSDLLVGHSRVCRDIGLCVAGSAEATTECANREAHPRVEATGMSILLLLGLFFHAAAPMGLVTLLCVRHRREGDRSLSPSFGQSLVEQNTFERAKSKNCSREEK